MRTLPRATGPVAPAVTTRGAGRARSAGRLQAANRARSAGRIGAAILAAVLAAGCQGAGPASSVPSASDASPSAVVPSPSAALSSSSPGTSATPIPAGGKWIEAGEMQVARTAPHLVLLGDGRVLAVGDDAPELEGGAFCYASDDTVTAELWDPATGRWTATASLATPRALEVAVPLPDGRALVTGGATGPKKGADPWVIGGYQSYSSTWIFDPATESWTKSGLLDTARAAAAGATLPDGRVLVAGGFFADYIRWSDWSGLRDDRYNECTPPEGGAGAAGVTAGWRPDGLLLDVALPHPPATLLASAELFDPASGTGPRRDPERAQGGGGGGRACRRPGPRGPAEWPGRGLLL